MIVQTKKTINSMPHPSPDSPSMDEAVAPPYLRLVAGLLLGFVAAVVAGKLSIIGSVKSVDEAIFNAVVPLLQDIPGLTSFSERATDLGAIPVNYGMALALALFVSLQKRHVLPGVVTVVTVFGAHVFQNVTHRLVEGFAPTEHVLGAAGPYFSGGVMRVILLAGMVATLALPRHADRWIWRLAIALGLFEAFTRLVLGRHWPIDLVASFPIGLGLVYLFKRVAERWRPTS